MIFSVIENENSKLHLNLFNFLKKSLKKKKFLLSYTAKKIYFKLKNIKL